MEVTNPAGFWRRLLAILLDALIVGIPISTLGYFITGTWDTNWLTLGIGLTISAIMVAIREDKRSIHDFIAGTYVTTDEPTV